MNRLHLFLTALIVAIITAIPTQVALGQAVENEDVVPAPAPRQSPTMLAATHLDNGNTYIKVVYGSPRMRERTVFGGLVPYGQVWRTGANEATELTLTNAVNFAGETVEAGTYSVFSIPGEDTWTIILSSGLGQWGAFQYDEALDVLRVEVPADTINASHEAFSIDFDEADGGTNMVITWDRTRVRVPIRSR